LTKKTKETKEERREGEKEKRGKKRGFGGFERRKNSWMRPCVAPIKKS